MKLILSLIILFSFAELYAQSGPKCNKIKMVEEFHKVTVKNDDYPGLDDPDRICINRSIMGLPLNYPCVDTHGSYGQLNYYDLTGNGEVDGLGSGAAIITGEDSLILGQFLAAPDDAAKLALIESEMDHINRMYTRRSCNQILPMGCTSDDVMIRLHDFNNNGSIDDGDVTCLRKALLHGGGAPFKALFPGCAGTDDPIKDYNLGYYRTKDFTTSLSSVVEFEKYMNGDIKSYDLGNVQIVSDLHHCKRISVGPLFSKSNPFKNRTYHIYTLFERVGFSYVGEDVDGGDTVTVTAVGLPDLPSGGLVVEPDPHNPFQPNKFEGLFKIENLRDEFKSEPAAVITKTYDFNLVATDTAAHTDTRTAKVILYRWWENITNPLMGNVNVVVNEVFEGTKPFTDVVGTFEVNQPIHLDFEYPAAPPGEEWSFSLATAVPLASAHGCINPAGATYNKNPSNVNQGQFRYTPTSAGVHTVCIISTVDKTESKNDGKEIIGYKLHRLRFNVNPAPPAPLKLTLMPSQAIYEVAKGETLRIQMLGENGVPNYFYAMENLSPGDRTASIVEDAGSHYFDFSSDSVGSTFTVNLVVFDQATPAPSKISIPISIQVKETVDKQPFTMTLTPNRSNYLAYAEVDKVIEMKLSGGVPDYDCSYSGPTPATATTFMSKFKTRCLFYFNSSVVGEEYTVTLSASDSDGENESREIKITVIDRPDDLADIEGTVNEEPFDPDGISDPRFAHPGISNLKIELKDYTVMSIPRNYASTINIELDVNGGIGDKNNYKYIIVPKLVPAGSHTMQNISASNPQINFSPDSSETYSNEGRGTKFIYQIIVRDERSPFPEIARTFFEIDVSHNIQCQNGFYAAKNNLCCANMEVLDPGGNFCVSALGTMAPVDKKDYYSSNGRNGYPSLCQLSSPTSLVGETKNLANLADFTESSSSSEHFTTNCRKSIQMYSYYDVYHTSGEIITGVTVQDKEYDDRDYQPPPYKGSDSESNSPARAGLNNFGDKQFDP